MGILYSVEKQPLLYFDDANSGYVYPDAAHSERLCYFSDGDAFLRSGHAEAGRKIAQYSLIDMTVRANDGALRLESGTVSRENGSESETVGSYTGGTYGAAAAAAAAFLGSAGRLPQPQTGDNSAKPAPTGLRRVLYAAAAFLLGDFSVLLLSGLLWLSGVTPVALVRNVLTFPRALADGAWVPLTAAFLVSMGGIIPWIILRVRRESRRKRAIYGAAICAVPMLLFVAGMFLQREGENPLLNTAAFFLIGAKLVFYGKEIVFRGIRRRFASPAQAPDISMEDAAGAAHPIL